MLDFLANKIQKSLKKLKKNAPVSESDLDEVLKDIRYSLLESDVNLEVVKAFLSQVKSEILAKKILDQIFSREEIVKVFLSEITNILGKAKVQLKFKNHPKTIMLVGLQGSGKTTTTLKLAKFLLSEKMIKKPLVVSLDTQRFAAQEQLKILATRNNIDFFTVFDEKNPAKIAQKALEFSYQNHHDLLVFDTAGRLSIDQNLMQELASLKDIINPQKILFVADSMSGQETVNVAKSFDQQIRIDGSILTKLDSDTRGGVAMSISFVLQKPIFFLGTGEKANHFEFFEPERLARRILGMGDILALAEKIKKNIDLEKSKNIGMRLQKGKFNFNDLIDSLEQINKLGNFKKVMAFIPGAPKVSDAQLQAAENKVNLFKTLINSMTKQEREYPRLLSVPARQLRIVKGSGKSINELNFLLREFKNMATQLKNFAPKNMARFNHLFNKNKEKK